MTTVEESVVMASLEWICDTCGAHHPTEPWDCPGCQKEVCESCFWSYAHCPPCTEGKNDSQLLAAANAAGFEFEDDEETEDA